MGKNLLHIVFLALLALASLPVAGQAPSIYKVSKTNFNENYFSEISPVMADNGIFFCSNRRTSGAKDRTSFDEKRLYNIWFAEKIDSFNWKKPVEIKSERSSLFNNGPLCIGPNGKTVYFTSEVETGKITKNRRFKNHSGIFIAELEGDMLVSVRPFKYNSNKFDVAHPSISSDGQQLYFASNMEGGRGGSDIWVCDLVDGEWSVPTNLGDKVNSGASENYPFSHESGRLYFSSNRAGGLGGMDIYYSSGSSDGWSTPVNLVEPINSKADDFAFTVYNDGSSGFFSSNRNRDDDIYGFISTIIRKSKCDELMINNYCYEFLEENAVKYDTIPFQYEWEFGDGEKAIGDLVDHCYPGPGRYTIKLNVQNLITGDISLNEKTYYLDIVEYEQPYITSADTVSVGESISLSAEETNLPGWNIEKYYWNFDDETINVGEIVTKSWTEAGVFDIQLIVTSKKDQYGTVNEMCVGKKIVVE